MSYEENWRKVCGIAQDTPALTGETVFLFGAGLIGSLAAATLKSEIEITAICDNNTAKQGTMVEGLPCISPNELKRYQHPFVLISTNKYYKSVHRQLEHMGIPHCSLDAYALRSHFTEFETVFHSLDEVSKTVYSGVLLGRMTGDMDVIEQYCCDNQYFCLPKFRYLDNNEGVLINCGAYVGDTVESIVKNSFGSFRKIYAFEPNEKLFNALQKRVKLLSELWALSEEQIVCEKKGVGQRSNILYFRDSERNLSTSLSAVPTVSKHSVEVVSLDEYLFQQHKNNITFINADIEGSEWDMLHGAQKIIRHSKPKLAISIYHNIFDFFRIQLYLKELVPEYRFHVRHHSSTDVDTVLYCHI